MRSIRRLGLCVLVATLLVGCMPGSGSRYVIFSERSFILFGQYEINCRTSEWQGHVGLGCEIYFLTAVPVGSNCDTLPILIMDKLQVSDGCLTEPVNYPMAARLAQDWFTDEEQEFYHVEKYEDLWQKMA